VGKTSRPGKKKKLEGKKGKASARFQGDKTGGQHYQSGETRKKSTAKKKKNGSKLDLKKQNSNQWKEKEPWRKTGGSTNKQGFNTVSQAKGKGGAYTIKATKEIKENFQKKLGPNLTGEVPQGGTSPGKKNWEKKTMRKLE